MPDSSLYESPRESFRAKSGSLYQDPYVPIVCPTPNPAAFVSKRKILLDCEPRILPSSGFGCQNIHVRLGRIITGNLPPSVIQDVLAVGFWILRLPVPPLPQRPSACLECNALCCILITHVNNEVFA